MTFDELEIDAKDLLDIRPDGWTRSNLFNMVKLAEEAGEVAGCLAKSCKTKEDLGEELSDVMIVVTIIALIAGIDLDQACRNKQKKRIKKLIDRFHEGHSVRIGDTLFLPEGTSSQGAENYGITVKYY